MLKSYVNKLTLTNCAYHIIQTTGARPSWKFEVGMHNKTYSISYYENRAINFFLAVYDRNGNKRLLLLALNVFLFWNQNSSFVEIFPFLLFTGWLRLLLILILQNGIIQNTLSAALDIYVLSQNEQICYQTTPLDYLISYYLT